MMSAMDVFGAYGTLWERAKAAGACVHYYDDKDERSDLHSDSSGATGWFLANVDIDDGQPIIQLYRRECDDDSFAPNRCRGPHGAELPPPDLKAELITLAHEYGHLLSFLEKTPRSEWGAFKAAERKRDAALQAAKDQLSDGMSRADVDERVRAALREALTDEERMRILNEEALAWTLGREALSELEMVEFGRFDGRRTSGLHSHRCRLGMEDPSPGDESRMPTE